MADPGMRVEPPSFIATRYIDERTGKPTVVPDEDLDTKHLRTLTTLSAATLLAAYDEGGEEEAEEAPTPMAVDEESSAPEAPATAPSAAASAPVILHHLAAARSEAEQLVRCVVKCVGKLAKTLPAALADGSVGHMPLLSRLQVSQKDVASPFVSTDLIAATRERVNGSECSIEDRTQDLPTAATEEISIMRFLAAAVGDAETAGGKRLIFVLRTRDNKQSFFVLFAMVKFGELVAGGSFLAE